MGFGRFADDAARATILRRWTEGEAGFVSPRCGGTQALAQPSRHLHECRACRKHVSLTVGTVLHDTRKPLHLWFLAPFLLGHSKQGVSALEPRQALGWGGIRRREPGSTRYAGLSPFAAARCFTACCAAVHDAPPRYWQIVGRPDAKPPLPAAA